MCKGTARRRMILRDRLDGSEMTRADGGLAERSGGIACSNFLVQIGRQRTVNVRFVSTARIPRTLIAFLVLGALVAAACTGDDDGASTTTTTPTTATDAVPEVTEPADDSGGDSGGDTVEPAPDPQPDESTPEYSATIRRTSNNVPHIVGDTLADAGYGYGYAFAEDHLCSLADAVIQVRSEAAGFHGRGDNDKWLNQDLVYLALDLYGGATDDLDGADPTLQGVIRGYAAGYNDYLAATGADSVPGYCAGEPWVRPIDEYDLAAYYKALSWRASVDPLIGFIASAEPPAEAATAADDDDTGNDAIDESALAALSPDATTLASNAWAAGPDRTADGTTMLVGNPHFPWQGMLRMYEVHLTVPGELDVYGVSLLGSPAVQIGFNDAIAWSHTVSAGRRFTAYSLDLVPGDPTSYRYGDEVREMSSVDVAVEVLQPDGSTLEVERTFWASHYGPVIDFPGVGWSTERTLTFRDANADNDELLPQFFAMNTARSMDEFIEAHATWQGVPWVNTIAASADGRIWYADTSATPNLSDEAIAAWKQQVESDPITSIALDNGVVLLDGSDPLFEWVDDPAARDPGVVPFSKMPQLERTDVVFNANDPYWYATLDEVIAEVSPLHGNFAAPLSNRTRGNAAQLHPERGDSGSDGLFTFEEFRDSAIGNRVFTAEQLVDEVVDRCRAEGADAEMCDVLEAWDRRVDVTSVGAALWREFIDSFPNAALVDAGALWASPFDPADPLNTPSGLSADPEIVPRLEAAAERLSSAGFAVDAPLGDLQFTERNGERIPIHGGTGAEGVSNVVGFGRNTTTAEIGFDRGEVVEGSRSLTATGYPITNGTSFIYALEFTADGPVAQAFLTYGQTGDPASEFFGDQTKLFSAKQWRTLLFDEASISSDPALREYTVQR
jgi:acyl-homoserine-lactone acylase